tara:strand:+ start:449 stop:1060 length:612 start_codon:yes stop_codon:yes gene_type:complete
MKLLREYYELCEGGVCQDLLTETEKAFVRNGGIILSGLMQEAEKPNGNNRVYKRETLLREVENYKKLVKEKRSLGELDHPDTSVIQLEKCSHLVTDIWMEDNKVMGKIKVLTETPMGKILAGLVKEGVSLGISSRGQGSVKENNGVTLVEDDFQLICFDMVSDPSTAGAYMMTEAKDHSNTFTHGDRVNRALNSILMKHEEKE